MTDDTTDTNDTDETRENDTDDESVATTPGGRPRPPDHPANATQPTVPQLRRIIERARDERGDAYPFDQPERTPDVTGTSLGSWNETCVDGIVLRHGTLSATTSAPGDEKGSTDFIARSENVPNVNLKPSANWLAESRSDDDDDRDEQDGESQ